MPTAGSRAATEARVGQGRPALWPCAHGLGVASQRHVQWFRYGVWREQRQQAPLQPHARERKTSCPPGQRACTTLGRGVMGPPGSGILKSGREPSRAARRTSPPYAPDVSWPFPDIRSIKTSSAVQSPVSRLRMSLPSPRSPASSIARFSLQRTPSFAGRQGWRPLHCRNVQQALRRA